MKKIMMLIAMLAGSVWAGTNDVAWVAPVSITQTVSGVRLKTINVVVGSNTNSTITVGWDWLNANGTIIRSGVSKYSESEISVLLQKCGYSLSDLRTLFLSVAAAGAQ